MLGRLLLLLLIENSSNLCPALFAGDLNSGEENPGGKSELREPASHLPITQEDRQRLSNLMLELEQHRARSPVGEQNETDSVSGPEKAF